MTILFYQAQLVLHQGMKRTPQNLCIAIPTSISHRLHHLLKTLPHFPTTTFSHKAHAKLIREGITPFSQDPSTRIPCITHPYSITHPTVTKVPPLPLVMNRASPILSPTLSDSALSSDIPTSFERDRHREPVTLPQVPLSGPRRVPTNKTTFVTP